MLIRNYRRLTWDVKICESTWWQRSRSMWLYGTASKCPSSGWVCMSSLLPSWTLSISLNYKLCICSYKSSLSHHKEDLPPFGCLLSYTVSNYKSQQIKILFATTNAHKRTTNGGTTKSIENSLQKETKQHKGEFILILYRNRTTICQNWTTNGNKLSGVIHSTM